MGHDVVGVGNTRSSRRREERPTGRPFVERSATGGGLPLFRRLPTAPHPELALEVAAAVDLAEAEQVVRQAEPP